MFLIKAIYRNFEGKQIFIIFEPLLECFESIVRWLDRAVSTGIQQWKIEIMMMVDSLSSITLKSPKIQLSYNQSSHNPVAQELLTISLLKTPQSVLDSTSITPKEVVFMSDEDIIEVFI
jgi:hypothetical protein